MADHTTAITASAKGLDSPRNIAAMSPDPPISGDVPFEPRDSKGNVWLTQDFTS